jgi:hypothetical protein
MEIPCYFFHNGTCLKGDACTFSHKPIIDQKKQELFQACWPVIEHNWNWFYHGGLELVLWEELTHMLDSIKIHVSQ